MPEFVVSFRNYRNANCYIRWKNQRIEVRHADILMQAPPSVTEAIAFILLARLYRKRVSPEHITTYRNFMSAGETRQSIEAIRRERGRKRMASPKGRHFDLSPIFDEVNRHWFGGSLPRPTLGWALSPSRRTLGHYDPVHHAIVISSFLDSPDAGYDLVRYVMFHEMLHIKHPIQFREGKRVIHSAAFREEERQYPRFAELKDRLHQLCHMADRRAPKRRAR